MELNPLVRLDCICGAEPARTTTDSSSLVSYGPALSEKTL